MTRSPLAMVTAVLVGATASLAQDPAATAPQQQPGQVGPPQKAGTKPSPTAPVAEPPQIKPWLGLTIEPVPPALSLHLSEVLAPGRGVFVAKVVEGSPSHRSGVRPGDVLVTINGHPVGTPDDFQSAEAGVATPRVLMEIVHSGVPRRLMVARDGEPGDVVLREPSGSVAMSFSLPQGVASLTGVNGRYNFRAQYFAADGRRQDVEAEGIWDQVAPQIRSVSPGLRDSIARGLSGAPAALPPFPMPFGR